MIPVTLRDGESTTADLVLEPLSRGAREYSLAMLVATEDTVFRPLTFRLLWAPIPSIDLKTLRSNCGAETCFVAGSPQEIQIRGDASEIDIAKEATVGIGTDKNSLTSVNQQVRTKENNERVVTLTQGKDGNYWLAVSLPLQIDRLRWDAQGKPAKVPVFEDTVSALVEIAPAHLGTFHYEDDQVLAELRGASQGLKVRFKTASVEALRALATRKTYQLRELTMGVRGTPVAEFFVDSVSGTVASGTLMPVAATRTRTGRDGAPELVMPSDPQEFRVQLTVLPVTRVDQYVLLRGGAAEVRGALQPTEKTRIRLEGPGVGYLRRAEFGRHEYDLEPKAGVRDSMEFEIEAPREAAANEILRLWDADGAELAVQIPVALPQRPKQRLTDYAFIEHDEGGSLKPIPLDTAGPVELSNLRGIRLHLKRGGVDKPDTLWGVQYLQVETELFDAAGTSHGKETRCIAVVPPAVGSREYIVTGACTRPIDDVLEISELVEPANRATAQSTLRIRVKHDPTQYPKHDVTDVQEVKVTREGKWVFEPRLSLPGPVMAFHRGRIQTGLTYTAALFTATPLLTDFLRPGGPLALSLQGGFVVGSTPSGTASDALTARLATMAGVSLRFRDMSGKVAVDLFGGRVQPFGGHFFRRRDGYWMFQPGLSVPIGRPGG